MHMSDMCKIKFSDGFILISFCLFLLKIEVYLDQLEPKAGIMSQMRPNLLLEKLS